MRTATGFHADYARCAVGKMLKEPGPLDLLVEYLARIRVDPVQLKYVFRNVNAIERSTIPVDSPSSSGWFLQRHFGTFDAVGM
jgi:hypothetical protein